MYFEYNDGTYSVPTGSITNTNLKSTCNFPKFTLPYNATKPWKYTAYGNVPGKVKVQGLDSDGYYHYGEKYVEYRMQNAFPALVYYQNITNSTAQPQVKAHYLIELTNDQLLSGSNITFKAGYTINIIDNITIGNGSYTNFIIDPSLVW